MLTFLTKFIIPFSLAFFLAFNFNALANSHNAVKMHEGGLAMHGDPELPSNFLKFPYTSDFAKQGGTVTYGVVGTFDGLNPFILRGFRTTARGLFADTQFGSMVFETLMQRSRDESFTLYPLLAESYSLNDARSIMRFKLNEAAHFSDGQPVQAKDIIFSYNMLKEEGRPPFSTYMKQIANIKKIDSLTVEFHFKEPINRELPLIIASTMPILPSHAIDLEHFSQNDLTPMLGSGPYLIEKVEAGQSINYKKDPNYWGNKLAGNYGVNNFEKIRIRYFRNENALFESFKKGNIDLFIENHANRWYSGYNFSALEQGKIIKASFKKGTPPTMMGFVFNTRRPIFADKKVRKALSSLFDFNWVNRNLFNNAYTRTQGFWDGTNLSSIGREANNLETQLLAPFKSSIEKSVMDGNWHPSSESFNGNNRKQAEAAWLILQQAGFTRKNNKVIGPNGRPFEFEIMSQNLEEEKLALAYQRFLSRLGITAHVRTVDDTQYQNRLSNFDYDMIIGKLTASLSPGNEQINRWGSASRDIKGSFNYAGASEPAIDTTIRKMIAARSKEDFEASVRALDRLLISGYYYLPLYHLPKQWVAYKTDLHHPSQTPLYGFRLPTWWAQTPD